MIFSLLGFFKECNPVQQQGLQQVNCLRRAATSMGCLQNLINCAGEAVVIKQNKLTTLTS